MTQEPCAWGDHTQNGEGPHSDTALLIRKRLRHRKSCNCHLAVSIRTTRKKHLRRRRCELIEYGCGSTHRLHWFLPLLPFLLFQRETSSLNSKRQPGNFTTTTASLCYHLPRVYQLDTLTQGLTISVWWFCMCLLRRVSFAAPNDEFKNNSVYNPHIHTIPMIWY